MFGNDSFGPVIEAVDLLRAELREINRGRLHFRIVHRFRQPGVDCAPGEEVIAVFLVSRGREYQLLISPAQLLLADFLMRNSQCAQTASQIAAGIHDNSFYSEHGRNGGGQRVRRVLRTEVKEYVKRLHRALTLAFTDARLRIDPRDVLEVKESVSNHVLYRWRAVADIEHIDSTAKNLQPLP